ncbi:CheR family methyltransferase [Sneathiella limimaris]|uniref:CheR family methyltransferase n=1 Tax=Sneathiella limimaris TaxID=1964213 RepID=UPI00146B5B4B|nr:protein-glutamate O-methyltransferase [Sneathiella limimaris]
MSQQSETLEKKREFEFTHKEFKKLSGLIHELTGIVLGDHKQDMLYGRLARRLRQLGLKTFSQYCELLDSQKGDEETSFLVNAVTTNLTKFFREHHHFDTLTEHLLKLSTDTKRRSQSSSVLIWSAGCSSGEEPYSIATTVQDKVPALRNWDVKILATDLDTNMLNHGRAGIYKSDALKGLPEGYTSTLKDNVSVSGDRFELKDRIKQMVHFKQLNLLHQWPMKQKYDVIFCRNVLIYFDNATKEQLVERYTDMLRPGGRLFLGHSESLQRLPRSLKLTGRTAYVKEA